MSRQGNTGRAATNAGGAIPVGGTFSATVSTGSTVTTLIDPSRGIRIRMLHIQTDASSGTDLWQLRNGSSVVVWAGAPGIAGTILDFGVFGLQLDELKISRASGSGTCFINVYYENIADDSASSAIVQPE